MKDLSTSPEHEEPGRVRRAGFLASHLVDRLLAYGWSVTSIDHFDPFYSPAVKRENVAAHLRHPSIRFLESDVCNGLVGCSAS